MLKALSKADFFFLTEYTQWKDWPIYFKKKKKKKQQFAFQKVCEVL